MARARKTATVISMDPEDRLVMDTRTFEDATRATVQTIGRDAGVRVVFQGDGAMISGDGNIVLLPVLDADKKLTKRQVSIARGYANHETSHKLNTDMIYTSQVIMDHPELPMLQIMANAMEDVRIEKAFMEMYPGAHDDFDAVTEFVCKEFLNDTINKLPPGALDDFKVIGPAAVTWAGRKLLGYPSPFIGEALSKLGAGVQQVAQQIASVAVTIQTTRRGEDGHWDHDYAKAGARQITDLAVQFCQEEEVRAEQRRNPQPGQQPGQGQGQGAGTGQTAAVVEIHDGDGSGEGQGGSAIGKDTKVIDKRSKEGKQGGKANDAAGSKDGSGVGEKAGKPTDARQLLEEGAQGGAGAGSGTGAGAGDEGEDEAEGAAGEGEAGEAGAGEAGEALGLGIDDDEAADEEAAGGYDDDEPEDDEGDDEDRSTGVWQNDNPVRGDADGGDDGGPDGQGDSRGSGNAGWGASSGEQTKRDVLIEDFKDTGIMTMDVSINIGRALGNVVGKATAGHWQPFTRSNDKFFYRREVALQHGLRTDVSPRLTNPDGLASYRQSMKENGGRLSVMKQKLQRALIARNRVDFEGGHRRGRLDNKRMVDAHSGSPTVFRQKVEGQAINTAVTILVDLSGSMGGHKAMLAQHAVVAFAEAMQGTGVALQVLGFNNCSAKYTPPQGDARDKHQKFSRWEAIHTFVFKRFEENLRDAKNSIGLIHCSTAGCNSDGDSILYAWDMMRKREEEQKIVLVMSDGAPAGECSFGPEVEQQHVRDAVELVKVEGGNLVGIGIMSEAVKMFYPRFVVLNKLEELPKGVMDQVARMILGEAFVVDNGDLLKSSRGQAKMAR